jgi:ribosomal protein S21
MDDRKVKQEGPIDFAFEHMMKSFTAQVKKDGVIDEVKRRRYYSKPSEVKRAEKKEMEKNK